ncbi:Kel2p [Lachancea thermotolerans CBS 6340]|uniref:KLTH0C01474p n=1 Tax=Lachancea thermotolerans (strain ATCC 56472 / CBS 6340 / NRRL Y-8284) TaxID=559295 RepID=C5DDJ4_LACTC|nr:KLTH0C01474p [Lachancea thermotolerans CBS 6340]CAR21855.1 KLTH0C01474p [Lachancea thermotolerans CBS 6340]
MAPFKFAKKISKDKAKHEPAPAPKAAPQPQPQPQIAKRFTHSAIPEPAAARIFPTPVPVQQRNVSSASALQQTEYTPWSRVKLANSPFPRYRHVASAYASEQNQVYVIGGLHDQSVYGDTWIISAHDNGSKFSSKTVDITDTTPPPRVGHASTLCGNAFVIFGGDTHKVNSDGLMDDDVYLFNINSYKWTIPRPVGPRPLGRYGHKISIIATSQMRTKLYVFGGQFDDTYFNDLTVFDLSSFRRPDSHWQFIKPNTFTPPPLTNHTMISYDYKLWVFGGDTPQGLINDVFMFDPQINDWKVMQTTGDKPPPLQEHAAVLYGDLMCVVGGKDEQDVYSNSVFFLNLISLKWFKLPSYRSGIPQGRSGHSLTLLPNHKLLIMGGDKFDYARGGEGDVHTSDVDLGCGTLLYVLDLSKLGEQCPGIFDAKRVAAPQKGVENIPTSPPQPSRNASIQQNILTPFSERYQTPNTDQGGFSAVEKFTTPKTDGVFSPRPEAEDSNTEASALGTPQDIKKPTSPVPQLKTNHWSAQSPPPRVVSLSSANESELGSSRGHDSQFSGDVSEEYGVAMIGNSPSRPVVRESILPEDETLENLPSRSYSGETTPQREDIQPVSSTPEPARPVVARDQGNLGTQVQENIASPGPENMAVRSQENTATRGQENTATRGQESMVARGQENTMKRTQENSMARGEEGLMTRSPDNSTQNGMKGVPFEIIEALRKELGDLRSEAEKSAQSASRRIEELEQENSRLKESNDAGSRLVKLQTDYDLAVADRKAHEDRVGEVEDLLSKKFLDVARLHDIIRVQSSKIGSLEGEETFKEKYEELNDKYEQLLKDHETLKAKDREEEKSLHESIAQYSVQLEQFLASRNEGQEEGNGGVRSISGHHQKVIEDLRSRMDQMVSEKQGTDSSAAELSEKHKELENKCRKLEEELKAIEYNYESSVNSVNNASRALALSQEELNKYKQESKRLADELEEMKYKSVDRRDTSLTSNDDSLLSSSGAGLAAEPKSDMRDAPYRLKIKDLKAELFIIKQERNALKDDVMELKKKLLNLENEDD